MAHFQLLSTLIIFSAAISLARSAGCNSISATGTYLCTDITDMFPSMDGYGGYDLKCENCSIPIFGSRTFPFRAQFRTLNVSESGIKNITKNAFLNLPLLNYLFLQNNKIVGIAPGAFEGLQLYQINMDANQLHSLTPEFLRGLQTTSISIANNSIKEISPRAFKGTFGIMVLNLSNNKLGILHATSFEGLDNIEVLDLQNNNLCYVPLGIFYHTPSLRDLNLAGNKLRSYVPGMFSGLGQLLDLNIAANQFTEFNSDLLLPLNRLSRLDISRNGFFYLDTHRVHMNAPTLRTITIDDNLWSCSLLTNLIQYFKTVNIEVKVKSFTRYELTNVNGIACLLEDIHQKIPFEKYIAYVEYHTNNSIIYC